MESNGTWQLLLDRASLALKQPNQICCRTALCFSVPSPTPKQKHVVSGRGRDELMVGVGDLSVFSNLYNSVILFTAFSYTCFGCFKNSVEIALQMSLESPDIT